MTDDPQWETKQFERRMLDAISDAIQGTSWAPPEGGILVDALVVMLHQEPDGHYGTSWVSQGSSEQAEGMARYVIRFLDAREKHRFDHMFNGCPYDGEGDEDD